MKELVIGKGESLWFQVARANSERLCANLSHAHVLRQAKANKLGCNHVPGHGIKRSRKLTTPNLALESQSQHHVA